MNTNSGVYLGYSKTTISETPDDWKVNGVRECFKLVTDFILEEKLTSVERKELFRMVSANLHYFDNDFILKWKDEIDWWTVSAYANFRYLSQDLLVEMQLKGYL